MDCDVPVSNHGFIFQCTRMFLGPCLSNLGFKGSQGKWKILNSFLKEYSLSCLQKFDFFFQWSWGRGLFNSLLSVCPSLRPSICRCPFRAIWPNLWQGDTESCTYSSFPYFRPPPRSHLCPMFNNGQSNIYVLLKWKQIIIISIETWTRIWKCHVSITPPWLQCFSTLNKGLQSWNAGFKVKHFDNDWALKFNSSTYHTDYCQSWCYTQCNCADILSQSLIITLFHSNYQGLGLTSNM